MKKSVVAGLTGSTGAGKSTVSHVFAEAGFVIVDADKISREVTEKNTEVLQKLQSAFGRDIIKSDGSLERSLLARRAFADRVSADRLNAIVHPAVMQIIRKKIQQARAGGRSVLLDAPLLFEAGGEKLCDVVICVIAERHIRCERIMKRDAIDREAADIRISAQKEDFFYTSRSGYTIINNGSREELIENTRKTVKDIMGE